MALIEAQDIVKKYGDVVAVAGISFSIEPRERFGFLGPNGAGKTTVMKLMCCTSPLTQGELWVDGRSVKKDARQIKATIGVVPQEENLDPDLTVLENLLVYSRYFDIPREVALKRALDSLELFHLMDKRNDPIQTISGGMKKRLLTARALLNQPKLLLLDEPTTGLDPQARHLVWQKLRYLKEQGTTIVLSTHYMEEATFLCDRLVIMHQGKILAEGCPEELVAQHVGQSVLELRPSLERKQELLKHLRELKISAEDAGDTLYVFREETHRLENLLGLEKSKLVVRPANLEDVFLKLTGRGLSE